MPTALICGVSGQDGAYLSRFLLEKGYVVRNSQKFLLYFQHFAQVLSFYDVAVSRAKPAKVVAWLG